MKGDSWVALDVETATSSRSSICSVGIAVISDGVLAGCGSWLVQPPGNAYDYRNVQVHGIRPEDTATAPTFAEFYPTLWPYLDGQRMIAHWASFDVSALRATMDHYRLPRPSLSYACSCGMARRAFPDLANHRLPTVCGHCDIELNHHDAGSDAYACAMVALHCRDKVGTDTIHEMMQLLHLKLCAL